ncbi:carbohydrate kinase [Rhizobacter sp. AJA081-3]|uniref:carbohydrate kinase family protein n=1 Tax=Rhizobacter sp. AJA081-3 TaxID=2753607 RepID=UPI001ADFD9C1|nr:carbohydrate kinase [Rhizobacter sp. AJA081-3]QTN22691.1 carbohydrate kinase [Rhizobacter sp. AJA081-3]
MFVVCGEALFDVFATGDTPTGMAMDARVGGSPFNVAVGLARLAQPVCFLSQVSRGFLGERLMRALATEGVQTATVQRSDAPTTLSLIGLDPKGVPSYSFYGEGCADRLLSSDALVALPAGIRAINFGSYATVVGETAATQRMLVEREQGRALIAYDPNIRLNVEPSLDVWRTQIDWMLPRTQLLKVSDEDLRLVWPGVEPADFAARALAQGAKLVVVTRGGEGASGWTAAGRVDVPPVAVQVIDTVGAGDTFQAALLTWLAERDALSAPALTALSKDALGEALGFAARAAAITCSRRGADMPRRAEL